MATRSNASPRERILAAAIEEFSAHGVDATSIQRVADAAGMSKQALMHHFPSKERLREAVFDELGERLLALFPDVVADLSSRSFDRYRHVVDVVARLFEESPDIARFVLRELLDHPRETLAWLKEQGGPWLKVIVAVVEDSRAAGEVEEGFDAEAHVTVVAGLLLTVSALVHGGPGRDARWRRRIQEAALRLIRVGSHLEEPEEAR